MELFEAIYQRQSIGKVKPDALPREIIEKLLAAAVQAPNHHRVRPWRFVVMTGDARHRLGEEMAISLRRREHTAPESALEVERSRPLRAPLLIAVGVDQASDPKVVEIENICAVAAAVENLLLAATALGLGAMWRTGPASLDPAIKAFLGFSADQHLLGFIYLGYPEAEFPSKQRPDASDRVTWME
jgi:nitroreductase